MSNLEEQKRVQAEEGRVLAEEGRRQAESNAGTGRVKMEEGRVEAETDRVEAETNSESGRVIAEEGRVRAERGRVSSENKRFMTYEEELKKLQDDPEHYTTPGAKKYFKRVTIGYIILALAFSFGFWGLQNEQESRIKDINNSRAEFVYLNCEETNIRNRNTVAKIEEMAEKRKIDLLKHALRNPTAEEKEMSRIQIQNIESTKNYTISLANSLAPHQNCKKFILKRFGFLPDSVKEIGR